VEADHQSRECLSSLTTVVGQMWPENAKNYYLEKENEITFVSNYFPWIWHPSIN
jgi:hypothetical protein